MTPNFHLEAAIVRLMDGEALPEFCDWFVAAQQSGSQDNLPPDAQNQIDRGFLYLARQLWGHVPVPFNRWRPRGLPKLERNESCYCGSGRKYKQCCAEFEHMPFNLAPDALLVMALEHAPAQWLTADKLKDVPAVALGQAAMVWNDAGQDERTISLLGPLFANPKALDGRHEVAFDALIDAMQQQGQERQRRELIDRTAQHPDKALATAARCRLVSILADQGEVDKSWKLFHETSRFNPNDPQLWHLELSLLLAQGRQDEARLRAPLLAARARQADMPELAEALVGIARDGMGFLRDAAYAEVDDPVDEEWLSLAAAVPEVLDEAALRSLYKVEITQEGQGDEGPDGGLANVAWVRPVKKLVDLNRRWQRMFQVGKPDMTWLVGDVEGLMECLPEALEFLQKYPQAWLSAEVLDDLLMVAMELCDDDAPGSVIHAAQRLAAHAVAVLRTLVGDAQLPWIVTQNRPLLRSLAIAVELAQIEGDEKKGGDLLRLGLVLNPHDNHGWRSVLAPMLLEKGDYAAALALMDRYPHDFPPSEHLRALALFASGRQAEAQTVLTQAHLEYPLYLKALLPEIMDRPPQEDGPGIRVGGEASAWLFRVSCRHTWVRLGALAWAQGLQLPDPPPAKLRRPVKPAKATKSTATRQAGAALPASFGEKQEKRLRKTCSDYPRLHGFLQAVAWSPELLMPNTWIQPVMSLNDRMPNSRTEATALKAVNDTLGAIMTLYNHLNQQVMTHHSDPAPRLDEVRAVIGEGEAAVLSWAAGFVQASEIAAAGWARTGHKVQGASGSFGRLRGLAARAALQSGQSGVTNDDGKPLLQSLSAQPDSQSELLAALQDLWHVVSRSRKAP